MALDRIIPQKLMTCRTAINSFITGTPEFSRPYAEVKIRGESVRALFDTASAVTLCNDFIKTTGSISCSLTHQPLLKTANGTQLIISHCIIVPIFLPNSSKPIPQKVLFVRHLQVLFLLGMDFITKARITINIFEWKKRVLPEPKNKMKILMYWAAYCTVSLRSG